MRWFASLNGAGLLLAGLVGFASAQHYPAAPHWYPHSPFYPAYPGGYANCPTPMPYGPPAPSVMPYAPAPTTPTTPSAPGASPSAPSTNAPGTPSSPATTPDAGASAGAAAAAGDTARSDSGAGGGGERGSGSVASLAPNMFGDAFSTGARATSIRRPVTFPIGGTFTAPGTNQIVGFPISPTTIPPGPVPAGVVPTFLIPAGGVVQVAGVPINEDYRAAGPGVNGRFPLLQNTQDFAASLADAQARFGPGGVLVYNSARSHALDLATVNPAFANFASISVFYDYTLQQQFAALSLPTPSGGGVVGRTKVADDNSPLPRDRVIFGYDYYSGVTAGYGPNNVHRFSPGVEMTFFDQRTSLEVRVPFASTLNSDFNSNGVDSYAAELGNVHLTLKGLLYRSCAVNVAAGLGIGLPTADDFKILLPNRTPYVQVRNEAVVLTPYAAVLFTPGDRFFAQAWYAMGFDAGGNTVDANIDMGGLRFVGRLNDGPLSQADLQLGYWFVKNPGPYAVLRGLAGFVELHHNAILTEGDAITSGPVIITSSNRVQELNFSGGFIFNLGDSINLSMGAVVPMLQNNRSFDWQAGLRLNVFFGPTLRDRSASTGVSTF